MFNLQKTDSTQLNTVIMDVMNPQQARVAEEAGAVAVVRTLSRNFALLKRSMLYLTHHS